MAHIAVPPGVPGIRSLFVNHPATARPMCEMCEVLLRGPSPLSPGERELIASFVSARNECVFCATCHSATAAYLLDGDRELVSSVTRHYEDANISAKMKRLLAIADKVRKDGRSVTPRDIEAARKEGATDADIHDTVLIAAMFCMFNRYVDGLGAFTPKEQAPYDEIGGRLAREGYLSVPGLHTKDPAAAHR
jgi:uncharacterized peroxidase-related enzyme